VGGSVVGWLRAVAVRARPPPGGVPVGSLRPLEVRAQAEERRERRKKTAARRGGKGMRFIWVILPENTVVILRIRIF
jgi:hypothetical protein